MVDRKRRSFLSGIGTVTVGSAMFGSAPVTAKSGQGNNGGTDSSQRNGFPPEGITSWGDSAPYGEGEVSSFASVTPSGKPKYVGVHYSPGVFEGLPYAEDFESGDANGVPKNGFWIQPANIALPEDVPAPFEYVGFGWNPQGHTPEDVYDVPHFDIHFYFNEPDTIGGIEGGIIEELPDEKIPEGYRLIEGGAIIPKMGAHMAPEDAPEFNGGEWEDTLIWGAADGDEDYELNFIEPMITLEYLEKLSGVDSQEIAQPEEYPQDGHYPTTYVRRKLGDGGVVVALADFETQQG